MKPLFARIFMIAALALILIGVAALLLSGLPQAGALAGQSGRIHLPVIRYDAAPTPAPTPTDTPYSAAAALYITPNDPINASTFNPSSFAVANESLNGERLTELRVDLSTAIFPDMVFDPFGAAGDTVAKDVFVDVREGLGYEGREYDSPHDGGFDVLVLRFSNFDRGDRFEFSVDVDPTSIAGVGAPGPAESGSVGGLELVGATITATFDDGTVLTNQAYRMADPGAGGSNHSGAVSVLRPGLPGAPGLAVPGIASPATVGNPSQIVRVSGPPGRPVVVLVVEGGLFTAGVPGGGFDLDPFEANSALVAREYPAVIGPGGLVDVPISLSRSAPQGGLNYVTAVFDNHYGVKGAVTTPPIVLELK